MVSLPILRKCLNFEHINGLTHINKKEDNIVNAVILF